MILLWAATALAQTTAQVPIWTFCDCLWDGSKAVRELDRPKWRAAGFNGVATQITREALTATSVDARFLDACKADKMKVLVIRNALDWPEYKQVAEKWPEVIWGVDLADDADTTKTPAELTKLAADAQPFLAGTSLGFTVSKAADHTRYGPIVGRGGWYGVQNYLGRAVENGEGIKRFAYERMLEARPVVPGKLFQLPFLGKNLTPLLGVNDATWRAQEYVWPTTNEAICWLGFIAGADGVLYYTAYAIDPNNATVVWRAGERRDVMAAYGQINAKIQQFASYLTDPTVVKGRSVVGNNVVGTWQKPGGSLLTVTVDLTSEWLPRTSWVETLPPPPPVAGSFRFTVEGSKLKVVELP